MQWLSTIIQTAARPFKWWVVVAEWEQGLRVRLGKNTKELGPGIHLRIPFLDRIFIISTRIRVAAATNQTLSTKDGHVITFGVGIRYQVGSIKTLFNTVADVDGTLLYEALSAISHTITTKDLTEVTPAVLEAATSKTVPENLYGLKGVKITVMNFCVSKCYRFISGDSWIPKGKDLDDYDSAGEK